MNFDQMRYVCETVDHGLNISRAAASLGTSQPVISRQIQLLEQELGVAIFVRSSKRLLALSEPGRKLVEAARRILVDEQTMRSVSADYVSPDHGELGLGTTYAHARYALPRVIQRYTARFPAVKISLHEGRPADIAGWLASGRVDLSISTVPPGHFPDLTFIPYETLHRVVLVPPRHPLLRVKHLTLDELARYPIITLHRDSTGGTSIETAFRVHGLAPRVAVRAANADVIKAYVQTGLGIGIVSNLAVPRHEAGLCVLNAAHLFPDHRIAVGLRRRHYVRPCVFAFLKCVDRRLDRELLLRAPRGGVPDV